jgi:hypothetical protein
MDGAGPFPRQPLSSSAGRELGIYENEDLGPRSIGRGD